MAASRRKVTPAVAGALIILALAFALSVAFVLANGGLDLPAASGPGASSQPGGGAPAPTGSGNAAPGATSADGSSVPTSPAFAGTAASSGSAPGLALARRPTAGPSSDRYELLTACPGTPDCWIYVVRRGDNLTSIASYFGVSLKVVESRNPWTRTTRLVAGQKLRLPAPTK